MIAEHIVLAESEQIPMVLRPYQYYAVKALERRVKDSNKNGYIWHTTGAGKTLTAFKTSQILSRDPDIKKVLFVVVSHSRGLGTEKIVIPDVQQINKKSKHLNYKATRYKEESHLQRMRFRDARHDA